MRRAPFNVVLAVGFLALTTSIAVAHRSPAAAYESSIYAATPTLTWVGIGLALAIAVGLTVSARGWYQTVAMVLGAMSVTTIVSLPTIRNYHFQGKGDALTHLGWVNDFMRGDMLPHELLYPGLHSVASALHLAGGVPVERATILAVVILFVPFLVFVPLIARDITGSMAAAGFAAIVSWMVLPVNNVATHMGPHTNSNALFIVPLVLFALLVFINRQAHLERLPFGVSPFSALLVFTGIALLLVHPQQMINVVVLVAAIAFVQYLAKRRYDDHPAVQHPATYAHTALLGGVFVLWVSANERFRRGISGLVFGLLEQDIGGGAEVDQREGSLEALGGSLFELFSLMFLVAAIIGLIAGLFILATWLGKTSLDRESRTFVTYLSLALIPLFGIFMVYFFGTPTMAFRQVGFIYVILTVLGGIALAHLFGWVRTPLTTPGANALASVFLAACLVLALMTVFASPIIYLPTQHVTEEQKHGYETSLEHRNAEQFIVGYGYSPSRYGDAYHGTEGGSEINYDGGGGGQVFIDEFEAGNYSGAYYGADYYLAISVFDETRELEIFQELHHSRAALEAIEDDENVNKVVSNDEFRLYDVTGIEDEDDEEATTE